MNFLRRFLLSILAMSFCVVIHGQKSEEKKWSVDGYVKNLTTVNFIRGLDSAWVENQIHHRLNFKWYPTPNLSGFIELRNRIFWGDFVKNVPFYSELVDLNNDYLDLSVIVLDKSPWLIHSMIDRAYMQWSKEQWEVRVGRQRINWGVTLVWNPNDLFNAFSFFDFDYEERPGSDGVRIRRFTGFASSIEFASNITDNFHELTTAGMWKTNKWEYDFQFLMGKAMEDLALGLGWAGVIKDASFKGELTYLHPYRENDNQPVFLASLSGEYSFESSVYLHGAAYLNSGGERNPENPFLSPRLARFNVRFLSPYKISTFLQSAYTFSPLVTGGLVVIFYPGSNAFFLNPTTTVSLGKNWDLDLIGQFFFDTVNEQFKATNKLFFIRFKWSY